MITSGDTNHQFRVELQEGVSSKRGWRFWKPVISLVGQAAIGTFTPTTDLPPPAEVTGVRVVLVDPATDEIVHASEWFTNAAAAEPERVRYVSLVRSLPRAEVLAALGVAR